MFSDDLESLVARLLDHPPDWIRHDLGSDNPNDRKRAEETLAAMIASEIKKTKNPKELV